MTWVNIPSRETEKIMSGSSSSVDCDNVWLRFFQRFLVS